MIDTLELRKQVRTVLAARPVDEVLAEPFILAALNRFFPEPVSATELATALHWNEARGWVSQRINHDFDRREWKLTERGRIKEGL